MRAVIQRVSEARVVSNGVETGRIGCGLVILVGIEQEDGEPDGAWLAEKILKQRIFPDEAGKMNRCVGEAGGGLLVVSQFTLHASTRKGSRPSFHRAADPSRAVPLYEAFLRRLEEIHGSPVAAGVFAADMQVSLTNDGPATLVMDSRLRE
jgi:D-tyrosyl-tRNA(Tyr) deacylase